MAHVEIARRQIVHKARAAGDLTIALQRASAEFEERVRERARESNEEAARYQAFRLDRARLAEFQRAAAVERAAAANLVRAALHKKICEGLLAGQS